MFRLAVTGVFASAFGGYFLGRQQEGPFDLRALAVLIPCALLVAVTVLRWLSHPEAIKDTFSGGTIDFRQPNPDRLEWTDWALWMTHVGYLDRRSRMVKVQKRFFLGLIPMDTVLKSTRDFRSVHLDERLVTRRRRHRRIGFDTYSDEPSHHVCTLVLTNPSGARIELLDLNVGLDDSRKQRFMRELTGLAEAALGDGGSRAP